MGSTSTWYCLVKPPKGLTSTTPGTERNFFSTTQSSKARTSSGGKKSNDLHRHVRHIGIGLDGQFAKGIGPRKKPDEQQHHHDGAMTQDGGGKFADHEVGSTKASKRRHPSVTTRWPGLTPAKTGTLPSFSKPRVTWRRTKWPGDSSTKR